MARAEANMKILRLKQLLGDNEACAMLVGAVGAGKSSLINSLTYLINSSDLSSEKKLAKYIPTAKSQVMGGHTMMREPVKLTDTLTILDNRGWDDWENEASLKELSAQIRGERSLDEDVDWTADNMDPPFSSTIPLVSPKVDCVSIVIHAEGGIEGIGGIGKLIDTCRKNVRRRPSFVITHKDMTSGEMIEKIRAKLETVHAIDPDKIFVIKNVTPLNKDLDADSEAQLIEFIRCCYDDGAVGSSLHKQREERKSRLDLFAKQHEEMRRAKEISDLQHEVEVIKATEKMKKKHRSADSPCSSCLVPVQSFLHVIIARVIILAGSTVLLVGSASSDRVLLQAGESAVIPFTPPWPSIGTSHVDPYFYTLRFKSKPRPFCFDGGLDVDGFKSLSQYSRFAISVEELATSLFLNLSIENVDTLDEDLYELTVIQHNFLETFRETFRKEVLVLIPHGPAKCFITLNDNRNNSYEVHCRATTGSMKTALTCYQNSQRVEAKYDATDNGQITAGVFLLPGKTYFSCCSHDVNFNVNEKICKDFEWPPSKNSISSTNINDPTLTPSVVNTVGNNENAGNTLVESQVDSGTCKQYITSSVSLYIVGMVINLFLCF